MKNRNQRIAFFLPSLNIGGIERVFITYANYLLEEGYDVSFFLCKKEGKLLSLLNTGVELYDLGNVQLRFSFLKLRKCILRVRPDIIISGGDFPNMVLIISSLLLKQKTKIVISQHNYYNEESKRLGWWAHCTCWLMRKMYPKAYKVIAVSDGIYEYLRTKIGLSVNKIVKIPNPINVDEMIKESLEPIDFSFPMKYLLFVGRLGYIKNLPLLLEEFEIWEPSDYYLVIIGDGEMMTELLEKAKKMKKADKIIFLGAVENPLPILRRAKLLVLPSLSEAYPTILLEALCLSIPVLATPTKGAMEILQNMEGTNLSNSFADVEEFAKLMKKSIEEKIIPKQVREKLQFNSIENIASLIQYEIIDKE